VRGTVLPNAPSRIRGQSLLRRLRALLLAAHRFGVHRAASPEDIAFSHRLYDGLRRTLDNAEPRQ
jgi:hypothetical protein